MPQYFFVLGRNPALSVAEIISKIKSQSKSFVTKSISREVLVLECDGEISIPELMRELGGIVKAGQIISSIGLDEDETVFEKVFEADNLITHFLAKKDGKIHFGTSIYDGGTAGKILDKITSQIKTINITIKENLRVAGLRPGFVRNKDRYLSSVSVWKNGLLTDGMEIVLIICGDKIMIGKTQAVQEFESFSFRDYGRPERDKRSGIMPPKLGRIMINLADIPNNGILLDPFCGSGTIIQEAVLLGYTNILGSDISQKAVTDTKKNIDWLFTHYKGFDPAKFHINIFPADVRLISDTVKQNSIDAVVSEPFLGPPLFRMPNLYDTQKIFREVEELYLTAFTQFHKILKNSGKGIFIFPAFEINGRMQFINILDKIKERGFIQRPLLPEELAGNPVISQSIRGTLIYGGKEHFVKREITSWRRE